MGCGGAMLCWSEALSRPGSSSGSDGGRGLCRSEGRGGVTGDFNTDRGSQIIIIR